MEKTLPTSAPVQWGTYRRTLRAGDRPLITASARWPRLAREGRGPRRIDRYYSALADRWIKRWEGALLDQAKGAVELPRLWRAEMDFTVTLLQDDLLSLYIDITEETGLPRPRQVRLGDIWQLSDGSPIPLREILPRRRWWRSAVLSEVRRQIGAQLASGESLYYEDWMKKTSQRFSPARSYLTGEGPVLFYPMESIAPALEGFPTFSLAALFPDPAAPACGT